MLVRESWDGARLTVFVSAPHGPLVVGEHYALNIDLSSTLLGVMKRAAGWRTPFTLLPSPFGGEHTVSYYKAQSKGRTQARRNG